MRILLRLSCYGGTGMSFARGALPPSLKLRWSSKRIRFTCPPKPCAKEDARGPTTSTELSTIVALCFVFRRSGKLGALTSSPTGVSSIVSGYRLIGFWNVAGELSKELESVEFVSCPVLGSVGHDIVLY